MTPSSDNNMYVYTHTRCSDGVVFYVGMGRDFRAWSKARSARWKRSVAKHGEYEVTILKSGLSWGAAVCEEIRLIQHYRSVSGGALCNLSDGGEGAKGCKRSDETKLKISLALRGKEKTEQHRESTRLSRLGKKASAEAVLNMKRSHADVSAETRAKISLANTGKKRSEETKAKISEKGKARLPETRAGQIAAHTGSKRSPETKKKMSVAARIRWDRAVVVQEAKGVI